MKKQMEGGKMEFIVRGTTVVNPERCFTADVWVKGEHFHYIHEHIPPKKPIKEIEGSDYYMLPGFFHFGSMLGGLRTTVGQFREIQEEWVKRGFTIYVDDLTILHVHNWHTFIGYELAMHHNSLLTHRMRLRVPYHAVDEALIRAVLAHRVPMLEIIMSASDSPDGAFWPLLLNGFAKYRLALKLSFSTTCTKREKRQWIESYLSLLVSMLKGRGIPLVLDECPDMVKWIVSRKQAESAYVSWEMNECSTLSFERKQFGMFSVHPDFKGDIEWQERVLRRVVEVGSRLPAKLFAVYPHKGAIVVGSEADFFLLPKKNLANDATFCRPSFVYTKGRRNKHLLFTEKDEIPIYQV
jgi:hypothetical protein